MVHFYTEVLLPTRARDQRLKCANNSNVAHFLIYETADMKQLILKTKYYATLCNFPGKQTVAVETATN